MSSPTQPQATPPGQVPDSLPGAEEAPPLAAEDFSVPSAEPLDAPPPPPQPPPSPPPAPTAHPSLPSSPTSLHSGERPSGVTEIGALQVRLLTGSGLPAVNNAVQGLSDPFCQIYVRRTKQMRESEINYNTVHPRWHQTFLFDKVRSDDVLDVYCWDYNLTHANVPLGMLSINVAHALKITRSVLDSATSPVADLRSSAGGFVPVVDPFATPQPEWAISYGDSGPSCDFDCESDEITVIKGRNGPIPPRQRSYSALTVTPPRQTSYSALTVARAAHKAEASTPSREESEEGPCPGSTAVSATSPASPPAGPQPPVSRDTDDVATAPQPDVSPLETPDDVETAVLSPPSPLLPGLHQSLEPSSEQSLELSEQSQEPSCEQSQEPSPEQAQEPSEQWEPASQPSLEASVQPSPEQSLEPASQPPLQPQTSYVQEDPTPPAPLQPTAFGSLKPALTKALRGALHSHDSGNYDAKVFHTAPSREMPYSSMRMDFDEKRVDAMQRAISLVARTYPLRQGELTFAVMDPTFPNVSEVLHRNKYKMFVTFKFSEKMRSEVVSKHMKILGSRAIARAAAAAKPVTDKVKQLQLHQVGKEFPTWKIDMLYVYQVFGAKRQGWNRDYEAARKIFESTAVRSVVKAQHAMLYGGTGLAGTTNVRHSLMAETGAISGGMEFLQLLRMGMRKGKARAFTYVLKPDRLYIAETGADYFKDMNSKHAVCHWA